MERHAERSRCAPIQTVVKKVENGKTEVDIWVSAGLASARIVVRRRGEDVEVRLRSAGER